MGISVAWGREQPEWAYHKILILSSTCTEHAINVKIDKSIAIDIMYIDYLKPRAWKHSYIAT